MQVVRLDCKVSQDFLFTTSKTKQKAKKTLSFLFNVRNSMCQKADVALYFAPGYFISCILFPCLSPLSSSSLFLVYLCCSPAYFSLLYALLLLFFFLLFWTSAQLRFCLWHACPLVWSNPLDLPRPSATGDQQIILFTADGDCRGKQAILFLFPALFLLVLGSWLWLGGPLANLMHNTLVTEVWSVRKEWEPKVLDINIKEGKKKKRKINRYLVTFVVCFR